MCPCNAVRRLIKLHPKNPANGSRSCSLLEDRVQAFADGSRSELLR